MRRDWARTPFLPRAGWVAADQVVSSGTNVVLTIVAARSLNRVEFGAFGVAFAVYVVIAGMARGLITEPLLSRPGELSGDTRMSTLEGTAGAALGMGVLGAVIVTAAAAVIRGQVGGGLAALAIVLPGLLVQDVWRYSLIAAGRQQLAVVNDAVWAAVLFGLLAALLLAGDASAGGVVLAWGLGGVIAALVGTVQVHAAPRIRQGWRWLVQHSDLGVRYWLEFVTAAGATQAALLGLGATSGLESVGAFRAAQVLFGPFNVIFTATSLAIVPEAARARSRSDRTGRLMLGVSAVLTLAAVAWLALVLVAPDPLGHELLGASWEPAEAILLPVGAATILYGLAAGALAGLRAHEAARESLYARVVSAPFIVGVPLTGAELGGVEGFSIGFALATLLNAVVTWWYFERVDRRPDAGRDRAPETF